MNKTMNFDARNAQARLVRAGGTQDRGMARKSSLEAPNRVYLIACGSAKCSSPVPARDLYIGGLFRAARAYAETAGDSWYILSGLHHLVSPDKKLAPYEFFLADQPETYRRDWAQKIAWDLADRIPRETTCAILAGRAYYEFLVPALEKWGFPVEIPMSAVGGIGKQLQWLIQQRENLKPRKSLF